MKKILVIDDDNFILEYIQGLLEDEYTVFTAKDGQEGLDLYVKHKPELVILDLVMPVLDGYQFLDEVNDKRNNTKFIVLTGAPESRRTRLTDYNVDDIISKPFKNQEFAKRIRIAINR